LAPTNPGGGGDYSEYKVSPAPGIKQWVYLTGVRDGFRQCLYVNGVMVRDSALLNPNSDGRGGNDFTLGCHVRLDLLPQIKGYSFFDGKIDEVRIMNTVPGADWVRLCYMNQKNEDMLVNFR
jgi:hypothetical protein